MQRCIVLHQKYLAEALGMGNLTPCNWSSTVKETIPWSKCCSFLSSMPLVFKWEKIAVIILAIWNLRGNGLIVSLHFSLCLPLRSLCKKSGCQGEVGIRRWVASTCPSEKWQFTFSLWGKKHLFVISNCFCPNERFPGSRGQNFGTGEPWMWLICDIVCWQYIEQEAER